MRSRAQFDLIILSGLFALSLALRLLFTFKSHGEIMPPDGVLYSDIAIHLLHGEGFTQNVRSYFIVVPPFYPIFLAFVYMIFGVGNSTAIIVIQALLGALTTVPIYKIAEELFNHWAGLISGLLFSIYSLSIYWSGFVLSETLFTLLVVILTYVFMCLLRPQATYLTAILAGLIWGLTSLTRPHFLFFVPFLWLLLFIVRRHQSLKLAGISTLLLLITIAPWISYLYKEYGCIIPIASHGGLNLWLGNSSFTNPDRYYSSTLYANNPLFTTQLKEGMNLPPCEQNRFFLNAALQFILSFPLSFVVNTYEKFNLLTKSVDLHLNLFRNPFLDRIINATDEWLLILILSDLVLSTLPRWDFKRNQILLWLILYYSIIISVNVIVSQGRYRLPIMPHVAMYGGLAISELLYGLAIGVKSVIHLVHKYGGKKI